MSNIILRPFQIDAIECLKKEVLHRWERDTKQNIKFQSPTGSGKTIIMAQFVRDLFTAPELLNSEFCFMWASIGGSKEGDLARQSRNRFYEYYGDASVVNVTGLEDLTATKVIKRDEILFFNWAMVNARNKEGRRIRSDNERDITWDGMLERTKREGRRIILIIDEAHANSETKLAEEQINLIAPKIVIRVTATHRQQDNIDVNIRHNDVINAGLIKKSIITQTRDDFREKKVDQIDKHILDIALKRREELKKLYENCGLNINPLLLVQLPNDESAAMEGETRRDWAVKMLRELEVKSEKIAIWLDKEKTGLTNITKNNNGVDVLLFKQAPSVGWDCPRAQIIVMYREIHNPVFQIQVLGRVLRMPEAKHYLDCETLNHSYLYTTYEKRTIMAADDGGQNEKIADVHANRKPGVNPVLKLKTYKTDRARYRDLDVEFDILFIRVANEICGDNIKRELEKSYKQDEGVNLSVIVDAQIKDYDDFIPKIREAAALEQKLSPHDVEKMYRKLCIDVLRRQEGDAKFGNASRSYGVLKAALNVWFEEHLKMRVKVKYYPVIVNDLLREGNSKLLPIINAAIVEYARVMGEEEEEREKNELREEPIEIPRKEMSYTSRYKLEEECKKCAMKPCFIDKSNENEWDFIKYLEGNEEVVWWYKNGDNGAENFSVKRDTGELFFPDWFVMTKKGKIWILDTKSGFTAEGKGAESRAAALRKWLAKNKKYEGGLIKRVSNVWRIATNDALQNWKKLEF